jgi:hypothetical protein
LVARGGTNMKKLSVAFVLIICAILCGCATKFEPANPEAFGTRWELLGVDTNKLQSFFDPKSITRFDSIIKFKCRSVDTYGIETIEWAELDCERNMIRFFDSIRYDKYYRDLGKLPDLPWQDIPKKSVLYRNRSIFCK